MARNKRGPKVADVVVEVYSDDRLVLKQQWASGESGKSKFTVCSSLGGLVLLVEVDGAWHSCELAPIVKAVLEKVGK